MLADTIGRRRTLLFGLSLFAASSLVCALAPTIAILVVARSFQGATASVGIVLARAMLRDRYDDRQAARMLGYLAAGIAVSPMVAPMAGGFLQEWQGWSAVFWATETLGVALLFLSFFFIRESRNATSIQSWSLSLIDFCLLAKHRGFLLYAGAISLNTGAFYTFIAAAPYIGAHVLGLSPLLYGSWFGSVALGYACGNFVSASVVRWVKPAHLILFGSVFAALATLLPPLLFVSGHVAPSALFIPMMMFTFASRLRNAECAGRGPERGHSPRRMCFGSRGFSTVPLGGILFLDHGLHR